MYEVLVLKPKLERVGWLTVGTAIDTYKPPKGGTIIIFQFSVNDTEYVADQSYQSNIKKNSRYLINFLPDDPEINKVLLDCPVPDSIVSIPAEGWEKPPFGCGGR